MLRDRLYEQMPNHIADIVCKDWLDGVHAIDGYIDHQSWCFLPSSFGTKYPDKEFFDALKKYFLQNQLVVLGGNDNEEAKHTLDDGSSFNLPIPRDVGHNNNYVCRYDADNDYWTIFEPSHGTKMRFRLTNDPTKMMNVPKKAYAPELIDIKITDYCPYNCKFCYMSSTIKGEHADSYSFYRLAHSLAQLKVFEVALGGGEPTLVLPI